MFLEMHRVSISKQAKMHELKHSSLIVMRHRKPQSGLTEEFLNSRRLYYQHLISKGESCSESRVCHL